MEAEQKYSEFEVHVTQHRLPDSDQVINEIANYLIGEGLMRKWAFYLAKNIIRDWNTCDDPVDIKLWALNRGFYPSRVALYGLTDNNYKSYLSDIDYFRIHPINNHFAFWINDKITLKYLYNHPIQSTSIKGVTYDLMPDYYCYIENDGHFTYLMNSPKNISHDENYLLNLVKLKGILALKPSNGGGGFGFVQLEYKDNNLYWNRLIISESELKNRQNELYGYIVTEFISQHHDFDSIWNLSVCTLRIIVIKQTVDKYSDGKYNVISSYARFGTKASDGACNMHTGGVAIYYNFETGEYGDYFFRYKGFGPNGQTRWVSHPDTGCVLKGKKLPRWEEVRDVVMTACQYLTSLEYFGVDVVVTNEKVQILEINSLPAISSPQALQGGVFNNINAAQFFQDKIDAKMKELSNRNINFSWRKLLEDI